MIGQAISKQVNCYTRLRYSLQNTILSFRRSRCAAALTPFEVSNAPSLGSAKLFASSSSSSSKDGASSSDTEDEKFEKKAISDFMEPTATNPASFLRGQGPIEDPRDVGQEMYWKHRNSLVEGENEGTTSWDDNSKDEKQKHELPADLVQFLEHVGPLKQTLDKEKSTPRAVKQQEDIEKASKEEGESTRSQQHEQRATRRRERMSMPLMGDDEEFTAVRNTNFARQTPERDAKPTFGTTGLQLYALLSMYQSKQREIGGEAAKIDITNIVESFYQKHTASVETKLQDGNEQNEEKQELPWTQEEQERHKELLKQSLEFIELPVLMKDSEGNFLGIPFDDVPPPEIKAVQPVPSTKMKLVMEDWIEQQQQLHALQEQRRARVAAKHDERKKARTNK